MRLSLSIKHIRTNLQTDEAVAKYKAYKNKLNHLLRISERKYYYDNFESVKGNLRSTWKLIKQVLNKGKRIDSPSEFTIGNKMSKNGSEIMDAFNNCFANIGSNLAKN